MKAKEVLETLRISRPTLCKLVKNGTIKTFKNSSGRYIYDDKSVFEQKLKNDLENQIELLKQYCFSKGVKIDEMISLSY